MELIGVQLAAMLAILFSLVRAYDTVLSPNYYSELCPLTEEIVRQNVAAEVYRDPTLAASLLRLHFHDCFVLVQPFNWLTVSV